MENHGWIYYNHSLMSAKAPHEHPEIEALDNKDFWNSFNGRPMFALWTTDFDCVERTEWWYCICDKPFDISSLKSKRRNTVKNALKNCRVEICNPIEICDELYELYNEAQNSYSSVNRINTDREKFYKNMEKLNSDDSVDIYVCFLRETGAVAGYSVVKNYDSYCAFQSQKAKPSYERYQVNAALVYAILEHYKDKLGSSYYICDGSRNINHITKFQDYLEKYFGFKKAYCKLRIRYKTYVKAAVSLMYPFRGIFKKMDGKRAFHMINGVLMLEYIRRSCDE